MRTPNSILQGRYRILRLVGSGGQGTVYEVEDLVLKRIVALKEAAFSEEASREILTCEARLLAGLGKHPALPVVFDYFSLEMSQFLVMEYFPGEDLAQLLKLRGAALPVEQVLSWAETLCSALEHMHSRTPPIIHRDIKPQNLKLSAHGDIVLLDFGLAKDLKAGSLVSGFTLAYAPLEQLQGVSTDARGDLYALAATLYQLLTGVRPIDALTRQAALHEGSRDPLMQPHQVNGQIHAAVSKALMKAMSLNRDSRPSTAAEFLQLLRESAHTPSAGDDTEQPTMQARVERAARPLTSRKTKYGILGMTEGHVLSVAFSPDGEFVAAGGWDKTIRLWNTATAEERVLGRCDGPVASISFSPNGKLLASASSDVRVWDVATGEILKRANQTSFCVAFSPDGSRVAWGGKGPSGSEGAICILEIVGDRPWLLGMCARWVRSINFSPDCKSVVSGCWAASEAVLLWDIVGQQYQLLTVQQERVDSVEFSRNGELIAVGGDFITLLNLRTAEARTIGTYGDMISSVAFSPDGERLASGGKGVCTWDVRTGQKTILHNDGEHINTVAYSPDGISVAAGGNNRVVHLLLASRE